MTEKMLIGEKSFKNTGSISNFNQKYITDLIDYNGLKSCLEIGTHIGVSGCAILQGLEKTGGIIFETVDKMDVNAFDTQKWKKYGPYEIPGVKFSRFSTPFVLHSDGSRMFFKQNKRLFDFIFIDGSHKKEDVKLDILESLDCLAIGGKILLHDYYSGGLPKWEGRAPILGIWQAVEELVKEGLEIKVDPIEYIHTDTGKQKTSFCIIEDK